jgi:hypothetical protein
MSQPSVTAAGSGGDFFLGMERGSCAVRAAASNTRQRGGAAGPTCRCVALMDDDAV